MYATSGILLNTYYRPEPVIPRILVKVSDAATSDVPHPAIVLQLSATFGSSASKENAPPIKRVEGITYVRLQNISCRDFDLSVYLQCILELTDLINGSIEKFTSIFKACIPGFEDIVHFIFTQGLGLCFYMLFKFFDQDMRGNGVRAGRLWKA
jgi:hypothetical protein